MKLMLISVVATTLIAGSVLSTASAAVRDDRIVRGDRIEALYKLVRSGRLSRNDRITVISKIFRLEAEVRKKHRDQNRIRDKQAALRKRGLL